MPAVSKAQQRAAAAELARRSDGKKKQKKATRPFGSASEKQLRDFVSSGGKDLPNRKGKRQTVIII